MSEIKKKRSLIILLTSATAAFLALLAVVAIRGSLFSRPEPPPVFGELTGNYTFSTSLGETFATSQMTGKTWLVSFFFTSCHGPCPLLNAQIAAILAKNPDLHALSITVDPETDMPEVLRDYAVQFKADPSRWIFARTEESNMIKFGQDVLKLPVGEEPDAHSPRIVLIDPKGQLRGWYDSQEPGVIELINNALKGL